MSERRDRTNPRPEFSEDELRWAAQHQPQIRRWMSGRRFLYHAMVTAVILGTQAAGDVRIGTSDRARRWNVTP